MAKRLTARMALQVIEDMAANTGLERTRFSNHKKPRLLKNDAVMDVIYQVAHAGLQPKCRCHHKEWETDAIKAHERLTGTKPTSGGRP